MQKKLNVTVDPKKPQTQLGEFVFYADEHVKQIELTIETSPQLWVQVFFEKNHRQVGQTLVTHHHRKRVIYLGETRQTSSATVKPLEDLAGNWLVSYFVMPDTQAVDTIQITIDLHQAVVKESTSNHSIIHEPLHLAKEGWVKGDLHTQTLYSDGQLSRREYLAQAKEAGLDFYFATDQNVITENWPSQEDVLVLPGCELLSRYGHCNYLGVQEAILTRKNFQDLDTSEGMLKILHDNKHNGLLSINHPFLAPHEWQVDVPMKQVGAIELVTNAVEPHSQQATRAAMRFWSQCWNAGWKITGVAGSHEQANKTHAQQQKTQRVETYVYVEELSQKHVLMALRKGHSMISQIGGIQFGSSDEPNLLPGMCLEGNVRHFEIRLNTAEYRDYRIEWVMDGTVVKQEEQVSSQFRMREVPEGYHWLRVDVRDRFGNYVATVTPVYWGEKEPEVSSYHQILQVPAEPLRVEG